MRVSAIIVNWNTRDLLLQCIRSLHQYSEGVELEIIVVDNASSDDSVDAVRAAHPAVRVLPQEDNLGFARANNVGIRESTGDYVCLVNSDIEVFGNAMGELVRHLEQHPKVGMAGPRLRGRDGNIQQHTWRFPTLSRSFGHAFFLNVLFPYNGLVSRKLDLSGVEPIEADVSSGAFCMVRRTALSEVGLLDEDFFFYGEDIDWCRRFREAGWNIHHLPSTEVIHYGGASSGKAPLKFHLQFDRARMQYWKKHESKAVMPLFYASMVAHNTVRLVANAAAMICTPRKRSDYLHNLKLAWKSLTRLLAPAS